LLVRPGLLVIAAQMCVWEHYQAGLFYKAANHPPDEFVADEQVAEHQFVGVGVARPR
jgi:hypothetical protein